MNKRNNLGDVPLETRGERVGKIVGTGGPEARQMAKQVKAVNNNIFVNSGSSVDTTSQQLLPANGGRNYLLIQNKSAVDVYVSFGGKADVYNGIIIAAGGFYEPYRVPSSSVSAIATAVDSNVVIVEGFGANI